MRQQNLANDPTCSGIPGTLHGSKISVIRDEPRKRREKQVLTRSVPRVEGCLQALPRVGVSSELHTGEVVGILESKFDKARLSLQRKSDRLGQRQTD